MTPFADPAVPESIDRILRLMAEQAASDVYLSAHATPLIKINGTCVPIGTQALGANAPRQLLADIVAPARMTELERTGELNLAYPLPGVGRFRISAMHQRGTVAVVIRYIAFDVPPLSELALPAVLRDLVMERHGLILMVGATGSGKSTTLAAMLDHRNSTTTGHILTIEEPIEYLFKNRRSVVNQREVGTDTASTEVALKNALRQAPDVIMIGEIRNRATMSDAIAYAQSGHLCLATLHASNSQQALNRILNFYPAEVRPTLLGDLAAALRAVISQRLLRTVAGTRTPAVEVMINTTLVAEMIEKGHFSGVRDAMENAMAEGAQTFEHAIARLIVDGVVDRAEGLSYADSPTNLVWRMQNDAQRRLAHLASPAVSQTPSFSEFPLDTNH